MASLKRIKYSGTTQIRFESHTDSGDGLTKYREDWRSPEAAQQVQIPHPTDWRGHGADKRKSHGKKRITRIRDKGWEEVERRGSSSSKKIGT